MSSSNRVRVTSIPELVIGETPVVGNFSTANYTSEGLSGTPTTTESAQIRSDRLASGSILTGMEVGGDLGFELSKDPTFEQYIESAMMNSWDVQASVAVGLELAIDNTDPLKPVYTLVRSAGDWNDTLDIGDIFNVTGFVTQENNTQFQLLEIIAPGTARVSASQITGDISPEVAAGTDI